MRHYRLAIAALTVLVAAVCSAWALSTPAFHGPDEALHFNSVNRLLSGGGWPEPYHAGVLGTTWQALAESGSKLPEQHYRAGPDVGAAAPAHRSSLNSPTQFHEHWRDQMVQHPPGYYLVVAGVVDVCGGRSLRWDHALLLMRLCSVLMVAAAVPFLVGVGRRLTGSELAGLVGGAAILAIPFFMTMGGYVTNDSLVITTVSASVYFLVRAADGDHPWRWLAAGGVALGLGLLVKGLVLMAIPMVGLLTLRVIATRRPGLWRSLGMLALPQVVAFVVGGWWWLRNLIVLGTLQPSQWGQRPDTVGKPRDFEQFARGFAERFFTLFWGRGSDEQIAYPAIAVTIATIALLLVILLALAIGRTRFALAALLVYPVLVTATTFNNAWGIFVDTGLPNRGVQGRYVFGGIVFVCAAVALIFARLPQQRWLAPTTLAVFSVITFGGWWWVFTRLWPTHRFAEAAQSLGAPQEALPATMGVAALALVGLLSLSSSRALSPSRAE